jgi:hypothetical protein
VSWLRAFDDCAGQEVEMGNGMGIGAWTSRMMDPNRLMLTLLDLYWPYLKIMLHSLLALRPQPILLPIAYQKNQGKAV